MVDVEAAVANGAEGHGSPTARPHTQLLEFAAAANNGQSPEGIPEELESVMRDVANTGAVTNYPWDALRVLLAKKMELVLAEFWRETPDVDVKEGQTFECMAVEPLTRSLLEPRREGAPFTVQRLCELLADPRHRGVYKSTRRYMYALQRAVVCTATEEMLARQVRHAAPMVPITPYEPPPAAAAVAAPVDAADIGRQAVPLDTAAAIAAQAADAAAASAAAATSDSPTAAAQSPSAGAPGQGTQGRKRKLDPESWTVAAEEEPAAEPSAEGGGAGAPAADEEV
eukprot:TRINITY_DN57395_c0_g1_i1.p1 TRINITY_DN57395_c0_g1~~TRINITY_DN57395_c0_g1_i1.p1  ORF type:complete len:284 (-),score=77.16 TRINITY_DN57395_c0_g1_i1:47-898(-)